MQRNVCNPSSLCTTVAPVILMFLRQMHPKIFAPKNWRTSLQLEWQDYMRPMQQFVTMIKVAVVKNCSSLQRNSYIWLFVATYVDPAMHLNMWSVVCAYAVRNLVSQLSLFGERVCDASALHLHSACEPRTRRRS